MSRLPSTPSRRVSSFLLACFVPVIPGAVLAACGEAPFSFASVTETPDATSDVDVTAGDSGVAGDAAADASARSDARTDAMTSAEGGDATADDAEPRDGNAGDTAIDAPPDAPSCPTGDLTCSGACVPQSPTNCGTCGHDCTMLPHVTGTATCGAGGQCTFTNADCAPGWMHCSSNPDDGCETNVTTSPNCGGCGVTCNGGTPVCNGTTCVTGCSGSTPTLCVDAGTCVDTTNDPLNCNGCGIQCAAGPAHSQPTCANSACTFACDTGYTGCPGATPTSCADLGTDTSNCGTCGNVCGQGKNPAAPANGSSICSSGSCDFTCAPGYTKCEAQWACVAPPVTGAAYVAAGSGFTAPSCGSAAAPCEKLSDGVAYAKSQGFEHVYVAHGSYGTSDGPITLAPTGSLTLHGGWTFAAPGTWTPDCSPSPSSTIVAAPSGAPEAILVSSGSVEMDDLLVQNTTTAASGQPLAPSGQSLYGVLASGAQSLTLAGVEIQVAPGGAGATGNTGKTSAGVPNPCAPGSGTDGTIGDAGGATFAAAGYVPGNGVPGFPGSNGTTGDMGAAPDASIQVNLSCRLVGSTCQANTTTSTGTGGAGGCGSYGSGGGTGGGGGGSSIGVFMSQGTLTITGGSITTASGGAGGTGGGGGTTLAGGMGQPGVAGPSDCTEAQCGTPANGCPVANCLAHASAPAGGAGSQGGTGGAGGQGGGGAGGDSYCFATMSGVNATSSATCSAGSAGSGGPPNGPTGASGPHN